MPCLYTRIMDCCDVHVDVQKEEEQRRVERQQKQQQERLARLSVTTSPTSPTPLDEKPTMRNKQNGDAGTNVTVSATITLDAQDEADTGSAAHPNSNFSFVCPPHHSSLMFSYDTNRRLYGYFASESSETHYRLLEQTVHNESKSLVADNSIF